MTAFTVITLSRNLGPAMPFDLYTNSNGAINAIKDRYKDKANVTVFLGDVNVINGCPTQRLTIQYDGSMITADDGAGGEETFREQCEAMYAIVEHRII